MNELQSPQDNTALVRRFGIRNRVPVASLSSDIQPVVIMDDLRPGPRTASGAARISAGIGAAVGIQLFNPAASNFIITLRQIRFTTTLSGGTWNLQQADTAHLFTTDVGPTQKGYTNRELGDGPGGTVGVPAGQVRISAAPAGGILFGQWDDNNNVINQFPVYHRFRPGTGIAVIGPASGPYSMTCWFEWEEEPDTPEK